MMKRTGIRFLAFGMLLGTMGSCSNENDVIGNDEHPNNGNNPTEKVESSLLPCTPELTKSVEGQYAAGIGILGHLATSAGDDNVLFSPFSFHVAASMVANGVTGETADELLAFLGAPDSDMLNSTNHDLLSSVTALDRDVAFETANAVWTDHGLPLKAEFVNTLEKHYSSAVQTVDYGTDDVNETINVWVKEKTHGMIYPLFDPTYRLQGPATVVNTLYMKAPWSEPFDAAESFTGTFHSSTGDREVKFMYSDTMTGRYDAGDFGESLTLPFGNGSYEITFVLPKPEMEMQAWIGALTPESVMQYVKGGSLGYGEVTLPGFAIEGNMDLTDVLRQLGLTGIFRPSLWSGMTSAERDMMVGKIVQKTKFTVDETGAEGSAATGVGIIEAAGPGQGHGGFTFTADRPFLFVVSEIGCRTPVFMGILNNP